MSNNWRTVPLSEICDINPRLGKAVLSEEELFAFVPMAAVGAADGSINVSAKRPFAEVKKGFTPFQSGDVLFAKITPCMENGKMAVVPKLGNRYGFGSTEFYVLRPKGDIDPKYVYHYVSRTDFRNEAARHMSGAVGQKRVPADFLKQSTIPLPPTIDDQKRIVAEIEKQLSRLDESVTALKRIQGNLKRYKAAVLKAAVEGRLTEKWRKEHPDVEPADQLHKRILDERRAKWETEELAKMKAKGIKPKDDSWKKKYKEPEVSVGDTDPLGWLSASVEFICEIVDGDRGENYPKKDDFMDDGYCLFLSTKNVRPDGFLFDETQFISKEKHDSLRKGILERGDIVFTSRGTLGNIAHYDYAVPYDCVRINSGMFILRGFTVFMTEKYFDYYLRSPVIRTQIDKLQSGTAQQQLPIREFKTFEVKSSSKAEQELIVQEIDRRLSVAEELEATIVTNLKRAERLRQTILQRAFAGRAVS